MPDYASILRRSISALPDPTPEMRDAVYQRARAALARQLTAVEPPLSTREIESQHRELEQAVSRVEADYAPEEAERAEVLPPAEEEVYYAAPQAPSKAYQAEQPKPSAPAERAGQEDGDEDDGDDFDEEDGKPSRLPRLAAAAVLVVVVLGLGAFGYAKRDSIFGSSGNETVSVVDATPTSIDGSTPPPTIDELAAADPDKVGDRLTNGSEPPAPAPEVALATPETPAVLPSDGAPAAPLPSEPATLQEEQTAALSPADDQGIVAQRAIYYFQGAEGSPGRAVEGSVTWAQVTRDNAPAVQATLRLAEPEVTTILTIYRNSDASLPASHMVEVEFQGALGSTAIQRVPALVLKTTEQARGEPLAGAAVPVTDNLFWIALSDDADEVSRNVTLLREGAWFDVPILFTDGTRALLTFEKGVPGDRVFQTVMAAWTPT